MASSAALAARMVHAHNKALEVLREHGTTERNENLDHAIGDASRPSLRNPQALATFQAELLAGLAEIVDQQAHAAAPKKRGRPRKDG